MNVISIEESAFYALIDEVIEHVKAQEVKSKWITQEKAMAMLNVKSPTTMQAFRNNGDIRYSQPRKRIILYDRNSIDDFLEKYARERF